MKAFGDATDGEKSPYNQSVKELSRTIIQQIRRLPGNQHCCDCGAPGFLSHSFSVCFFANS